MGAVGILLITMNGERMQKTCENHPDRHGIGQCVRCRKIICFECSTRYHGINYCVGCLHALNAGKSAPSSRLSFGRIALYLLAVASMPLLYYSYAMTIECLFFIKEFIKWGQAG